MFRLLGFGRNRKRQIHDANKRKSEKGDKGKQEHRYALSGKGRQPSISDENFLDNSSVDMSLYTTPSRATLQYHRGVHEMHDWQSHDSSVTPEVASVQSRLGGWEAPSLPPTIHEQVPVAQYSRGKLSKQSVTYRYTHFSKSGNGNNTSTNVKQARASLSQLRDITSVRSSAESSLGPVDVDSLELVDDEPADFSDLLSTFEAQSLADRIAPNTVERIERRNVGIAMEERSRSSHHSVKTRNREGSRKSSWSGVTSGKAIEEYRESGVDLKRDPFMSPARALSFPNRPVGSKTSRSKKLSSAEGYSLSCVEGDSLDLDDTRSLATEISGLTLPTMDLSFDIESRHSEFTRWSQGNRQVPSLSTENSATALNRPDDISFSGILSNFEEESRAHVLTMVKQSPKTCIPNQHPKTTLANESESRANENIHRVKTATDASLDASRRSPVSTVEEEGGHSYVSSATTDQGVDLASKSQRSTRTLESTNASTDSRLNVEDFRGIDGNTNQIRTSSKPIQKAKTKFKKPKEKTKLRNKTKRKSDETKISEIDSCEVSQSEIESDRMDEISFSGLLSTFEAESFAYRMDATSVLGNLELADDQTIVWDSFAAPPHLGSPSSFVGEHETPTFARSCFCVTENADDIGSASLSPTSHPMESSISSCRHHTSKRSNGLVETKEFSMPHVGVTIFSGVPSTLQAQNTASNIRESPVTKRMLRSNAFPLSVDESMSTDETSVPTSSVATSDVHSASTEDRQNQYETDGDSDREVEENAPPSSPSQRDDHSDVSNGCFTIDDQSTIPPPPSPDEYNWDEESWSPPRFSDSQTSKRLFSSAGCTESDAVSTLSLTQAPSEKDVPDKYTIDRKPYYDEISGCVEPSFLLHEIGKISEPPPMEETSLSYSASVETSVKYSEPTEPAIVATDASSVLLSADHRCNPIRERRSSPVDLDESVADSRSETSSVFGSTNLPTQEQEIFAQSQRFPDPPSVTSPLTFDAADDDSPFVDDDDEEEENHENERSFRSLQKYSQFDAALVEHSFKKTMESLSSAKHESGSLLLTEEELNKHMKSTQFKESMPPSSLSSYDKWKSKQLARQRYFAHIHKQAMKQKENQEVLLDRPSQSRVFSRSRVPDTSTTDVMMEKSISSRIQTKQTAEFVPRKHDVPTKDTKKGWGFLLTGGFHTKDASTSSSSCKTPQKQMNKSKKRREPAFVSFEHSTLMSKDEPDDVSLAPLNQLGLSMVNLTSSIPQGDTEAGINYRSVDHLSEGPHRLALQHLEMERAKNRNAEKDKTMLEIREQRRIALLKERELERQRRMNTSRSEISAQCTVNQNLKKDNQSPGSDQIFGVWSDEYSTVID